MTNRRHHAHVLLAMPLMATAALAQESPHELPPSDPPAPVPVLRQTSVPNTFNGPGYPVRTGVQVNTDGAGMNIVGDAANEPSLAVDPRNRNHLAVGWRQFDSISSNFRQAGNAFSRDGGRTWTVRPPLEAGVFRTDPVLRADTDGTVYYYSLNVNAGNLYCCKVFRSRDGGATYDAGVDALGGDKAWFAIDRTPLTSRGNMYLVWNQNASCLFSSNTFNRSFNRGDSYTAPSRLPTTSFPATIDVDIDGEVFILDAQSRTVMRSSNAKDPSVSSPSFSTKIIGAFGQIRTGGAPNPGGLLSQAWIRIDHSNGPTRGNVYLAAAGGPPVSSIDNTDVLFARSTDGGVTYNTTPIRVNDDTTTGTRDWRWFVAMDVAPNGRIDIVWNDTRGTGSDRLSAMYYAFSTDAGTTWSTNQQLTPIFDSHLGWPNQNKIGDYTDIESDNTGAYVIYPATFNGEQDVYVIRLGDYDCNSNGVGDAADIAAGTSLDTDRDTIPNECEDACPSDFNADGFVTGDDFDAFVVEFVAGAAAADVNADGFVTGDDFDAYVLAFVAGC